jgi:hypothetical protein
MGPHVPGYSTLLQATHTSLPFPIASSHRLIKRGVPARHPSLPFPSFLLLLLLACLLPRLHLCSRLCSVPALSKALLSHPCRSSTRQGTPLSLSLSRCQLFRGLQTPQASSPVRAVANNLCSCTATFIPHISAFSDNNIRSRTMAGTLF